MNIAVVGSRGYPSREKVVNYVLALPAGTMVISGGAVGVDSWAEEAAKKAGLSTHILPAEWSKYGKVAGFMRNGQIVALSAKVVAFWDGESRGTLDTIKKAVKSGKPVEIYGP